MAMNLNGFNAETIEPQTSYDPLPADWYPVMITDSEEKPTKAGTGSYLQMTLEVVEGQYKGRLIWERLNLDNPNSTAVEIAQRALSGICRATGVMTPGDSSELHNKPIMAKVAVDPGKGAYGPSNSVKEYAGMNTEQSAPLAAKEDTGSSASTPPWKR